jgi:Ala-tRNA(Pro) deacylase
MKKEDIYEFLKKKNIWHEITEHEAVWDMEELDNLDLPYPGRDAKNLFVRDDKKRVYYLISVKDDKRVDLNEFRNKYGTRRLSFASENDLGNILKLFPGAVSPFGLLNDSELKVKFYLDKEFLDGDGIIGIHPNDNTATVWLKTSDLVDIIKEHGNEVVLMNI